MLKVRFFIAATLILLFPISDTAWADSAEWLDEFRGNLNSVSSGFYHATGREIQQTANSKLSETAIQLFCAFDLSKKAHRFDREESTWVARKVFALPGYARYLRVADDITIKSPDRRAVLRFKTSQRPGELKPIKLLDFRIIPFVTLWGLDECKELEQLTDDFFFNGLRSTEKQAGGFAKVVCEQSGMRRTFLMDSNKSYSITKVDFEVYNPRTGETHPYGRTAIEWEEHGDVWVPKAFSMELDPIESKPFRRIEMTFVWEGVNDKVPEHYFTVADLGFKTNEPILDHSLGTVIETGKFGIDDVEQARDHGWLWRVGASIAVFAIAVVGYLLYRARP